MAVSNPMAGIYLHIPFCRQACSYCDFYFSTLQKNRPDFVRALQSEIQSKKNFFPQNVSLKTIYFGGGSPSILGVSELASIIHTLQENFSFASIEEFTFEANPDDISVEKLSDWKKSGINRLSIGIQSFHDSDLKILNRVHSSKQAIESVLLAKNAGFENITIDLMYGLPGLSLKSWEDNLNTAVKLGVPHVSMYALSVEEKTKLAKEVKTGKVIIPGDELYAEQFFMMAEILEKYGYEQYEISNFALPGFQALHNSAYWSGEPYLGLGPSAHSYLHPLRSWNVSNNSKYIELIQDGKSTIAESESLTNTQAANEFLMTRLRLKNGIAWSEFSQRFGYDLRSRHLPEFELLATSQEINFDDQGFSLTVAGKIVSDRIIRNLFSEE